MNWLVVAFLVGKQSEGMAWLGTSTIEGAFLSA